MKILQAFLAVWNDTSWTTIGLVPRLRASSLPACPAGPETRPKIRFKLCTVNDT